MQVSWAAPSAPEPPAPFPPRTIEHLRALDPGVQSYTLLSDDTHEGRKRFVRISYPVCAPWQQTATLMKALQEYQSNKFERITVQGEIIGVDDIYHFTNGQVIFDRNVRLGSDVLNRYQIETGNGLSADSIRVVVTEKM